MPTKRLPPRPHLDVLKCQARDLLAAAATGDARACERLRAFHPRLSGLSDEEISASHLSWSDGLFAVAREYGFASWPRLRSHVRATSTRAESSAAERIADPLFRSAVEAIEDGKIERLRTLLDEHPDVVGRRLDCEGEKDFRTPPLLAFVAENPVRTDSLPPNIVEITELLLERGAAADEAGLNETLGLVATGRVPREAGVQHAMIALLCSAGADPNGPVVAALAHGEFAAVLSLLDCGARKTLPVSTILEGAANLPAQIRLADLGERQVSLALAAQHGRTGALRLLLDSGADPSRYNPAGAHAHSTPLHQAALHGHEGAARLLLQHGANQELRDTVWNGTPFDWARFGQRTEIIALLEDERLRGRV